MTQNLPLPILTMISCYRGTIDAAVDNLTAEQLDHVIVQAKEILKAIECEDEPES